MIDALWRFPAALLALWALLAALWLWARPQQGRRLLDWAYPMLPLLVAMLPGLLPAQTWLPRWLQAGLWLWVWLTVVWLISLLKKDSSIMDMAFGLLMLALPWWLQAQLGGLASGSATLALWLATLGFGRYSLHILRRNLPHGEDARYARWRERSGTRWWWWSYFQVFLLQGVVLWVWALPLVLALILPSAPLGPLDALAAAVWVLGFVFEAGGDWQLTRFLRTRRDRSELLESGLWSLTRHPNYFGQACMWWGYALLALAHPAGWLGLASVAYITWFMYRGSATSLMEKHMHRHKPGYAAYCARVPAFFPRLWPAARQPQEQT